MHRPGEHNFAHDGQCEVQKRPVVYMQPNASSLFAPLILPLDASSLNDLLLRNIFFGKLMLPFFFPGMADLRFFFSVCRLRWLAS